MTEINKTCPVGYTYLPPLGEKSAGVCSNADTRDFFNLPLPDKDMDMGLQIESSQVDSAPPPAPKKMKIGLTDGQGIAAPDTSAETPGDKSLGDFRYFSTPSSGPTTIGSTGAIVRE